jgi:hypothetical protein
MPPLRTAAIALVCWTVVASAQMTFTNIAKGMSSGQQVAAEVVIRTPAEWAALWKLHAPLATAPQVDFATNMVVGVFLGTKPSAGFDVEIVGVKSQAGDLIVEYVQTQPGRGTITAQMLTEPYHLVAVPKHAGRVTFTQVPDTRPRK